VVRGSRRFENRSCCERGTRTIRARMCLRPIRSDNALCLRRCPLHSEFRCHENGLEYLSEVGVPENGTKQIQVSTNRFWRKGSEDLFGEAIQLRLW